MNNQIKHRKLGTEPLVGMYYVSECIKCGWIGSSGELTEDDAQCLQPVGDDHCWGDTDEIGADRLLELMQSGAFDKPAAQHQGEPVMPGSEEFSHMSTIELRGYHAGWRAACMRNRPAEQPAQVAEVPEGYCIMPRRLTAENGAKALLLGEFQLEVTTECPECRDLEDPLEGCEFCDGEGEYEQRHTIPWDQIKDIYSQAVAGLAKINKPL